MCPLCSHKPRFKVFAHLFQKAAQSRARSPCRCPQTAKLLLSFKKGRRGELSCQSNSRGEPTRQEGFSFICAKILYTVQRASTSSVTRDFASQNVSLRERDCHLDVLHSKTRRLLATIPHGGRLKNAPFRLHKPTDKSKFEMQNSMFVR